MNKSVSFFGIIWGVLFLGCSLQAMIFDNRYFPLIQHPFITVEGRPSHFALDGFVTTAHRVFLPFEEEGELPELFGKYDQRELARSFVRAGLPNPLPSNFQLLSEIPWSMHGKLQSQAFDIACYKSFCDWFAAGFTMFAMRSDSWIDFFCDFQGVTADEKAELARLMRTMHQKIGLTCSHAQQVGFSDIDAYLRFSHQWCYTCKFRKIDAGLRLGMLVPTGVTRNINEPASVPFGGNGHWGMYGSADTELELKEDWKLGLLARVNKRFARTAIHRMPTCKEPTIFGTVVGPAQVNPGITAIFSGYFSMENLRQGFGARLQLTWTHHTQDRWEDKRCDRSVPINFDALVEQSRWQSNYITLNAFYDFGKAKLCREFDPIVVFAWDVPVAFLNAYNVVQTHKVSLGVEFNF